MRGTLARRVGLLAGVVLALTPRGGMAQGTVPVPPVPPQNRDSVPPPNPPSGGVPSKVPSTPHLQDSTRRHPTVAQVITVVADTASTATPALAPRVAAAPPPSPGPTSAVPLPKAPVASLAPIPAGTVPLERVVAVVADHPILWSSVIEKINVRRAQGMQVPPDSAGQMAIAREVVNELVDAELLVQKASDLKIDVTDEEVAPGIDQQIKRVRAQFPTEAEYRAELKKAGLGTPEDYRRTLADEAKRAALQQRVVDSLKKSGKLVPVGVTEADIDSAYAHNRNAFPRRPATVTFRQIVIPPRPTPKDKAAAKAKADSILGELRKIGADNNGDLFAQVARRESMDPGTREVGGDLGWNRRGIMVPEFEAWMFALRPGTLSPVIETVFGYHIIRVERVKPAEVKASHILIRWKIDSTRVAAAKVEADSVLTAWKNGASFDSLVAHHHDPREEKGSLQPFPRDSLPRSYAEAFAGKGAKDFAGPFAIEDRSNNTSKFVVAQLLTATEGGEFTIADLRDRIREQLAYEFSIRRLLDEFRKETYVSIRL